MPEPETGDPFALFAAWFAEAGAAEAAPEATTLATADADGRPSARVVLLKGVDARGFVFYTNFESRKGGELTVNPFAALCFHWKSLGRQVRVEGPVARVGDAEADAYFATRARASRIGAWASAQSRPLADRAALMAAFARLDAEWEGREPPRPPYWTGARLSPLRIEFWREGENRLHDRRLYARPFEGAAWTASRLYP